MRNALDRTVMALSLALLAPAALVAQQQDQLPAEAQELVVEMQQIQARLGPVQQKALEDAELQQAQQELGLRVREAMTEADPSVMAGVERLSQLQAEAQQAQTEQDEAKMTEIVAEAQEIEQRLQNAQQQAMQLPEIEADLEDFQGRLERKMVEVDPEVAPLLERFRQIDVELSEILAAQPAG